jgi:hypothetical protein
MRRMAVPNAGREPPIPAALVLTSPPQPRRKPGLAGGSAAKVFEILLTKIKSKQQKKNAFFAAHPAGSALLCIANRPSR